MPVFGGLDKASNSPCTDKSKIRSNHHHSFHIFVNASSSTVIINVKNSSSHPIPHGTHHFITSLYEEIIQEFYNFTLDRHPAVRFPRYKTRGGDSDKLYRDELFLTFTKRFLPPRLHYKPVYLPWSGLIR